MYFYVIEFRHTAKIASFGSTLRKSLSLPFSGFLSLIPIFFLEAQHTDENFSYLRQVIKTLNPFSPKSAVKSNFFLNIPQTLLRRKKLNVKASLIIHYLHLSHLTIRSRNHKNSFISYYPDG